MAPGYKTYSVDIKGLKLFSEINSDKEFQFENILLKMYVFVQFGFRSIDAYMPHSIRKDLFPE